MAILTGAPGCGKTTLIRELSKRGIKTVDEAATDIIIQKQGEGIARPWLEHGFIETVTALQMARAERHSQTGLVFYDRSPLCTLALCQYLNLPIPNILLDAIYQMPKCPVFYIESLESIENNSVRTISLKEAKCFGEMHYKVYLEAGFKPVIIKNSSVNQRVKILINHVQK
jgi:predicted ATPase